MGMRKLHGKAAILAAAMAVLALAATANAVTKTYNQRYDFADVQNIEMDGLSSDIEITTTPQLAFPGMTLDEIHGYQFHTELYGGTGNGNSYSNVSTRASAYGRWPRKHRTSGNVDRMHMQFSVWEDNICKVVVLVLFNGDGGVYVQKYGTCYGTDETTVKYDLCNSNSDGNPQFRTDSGVPSGYTGSVTTDDGGTFKAWGIRIHGIRPIPNARLAFPGAKLTDLTNCLFVAGCHVGNSIDYPTYNEVAECVTLWPSSDNIQKIVMQFRNTRQNNRAAIIALTNGVDGVYATQTHNKNNAGATFNIVENSAKTHGFEVSGYTERTYSVGSSNDNSDGTEGATYGIWEFYSMPNYTYLQTTPMLLWTKKGGVLTLNDLAGAKFTALFGGASVNSGGIQNLMGETLVSGYNTREAFDARGNVTNIVTEFQFKDGTSAKAVIVQFENGADGVYGKALQAVFSPNGGSTLGYVVSDANGNYYYSGSNAGLKDVATSRTASSYGVCCLKAIADTARVYRQGQTLTFGVNDALTPTSSTMIPYSAATAAFSGMTLEDLSDRVFFAYYGGGAIDKPGYRLAIYPTLYPSSGEAAQLVTEFVSNGDGGWNKASMLGLAYNANGAVTVQKVQKTHSKNGGVDTRYFDFDEDGNLTYPSDANPQSGGNYDIYGLQIFPGFVKESPMLLFKGITLNDIEEATFTARVAGAGLRGDGGTARVTDRVNGYNKRVIKDGDDVTRILVEFQSETDYIKATIVEFTNGEGGVYGEAKEARYIGTSKGLGYQFVTAYDGTSITYAGNDSSPATSPLTGGYGVYDVQAAVEPDPNEWTLDQNRSWSYYTGGEVFDDDGATIRVKVTGNGATLTVDENATVGRIMFVNTTGADVTTNSLVIGSGVSASIGAIEVGAGGRLIVSGKIVINVGEYIEASGTIDFSDAKIELADPENLDAKFMFLKPTACQTLTVIGVPTVTNLPKGWKVSASADGTCRIGKDGFMIIVE